MLPIATVELQASETFAQTASAAHLQAMHQANAKCMVCWAKKKQANHVMLLRRAMFITYRLVRVIPA